MGSNYEIQFQKEALEDIEYFREHKKSLIKKIHKLLEDIQLNPFRGLGKPEPLRHDLSGCWSRHINREHRLVYKLNHGKIIILTCRFHYTK